MEPKNMVYDFTVPTKRANIEEIIETLTVKQIQDVAEFAEEMKKKEKQQTKQIFFRLDYDGHCSYLETFFSKNKFCPGNSRNRRRNLYFNLEQNQI